MENENLKKISKKIKEIISSDINGLDGYDINVTKDEIADSISASIDSDGHSDKPYFTFSFDHGRFGIIYNVFENGYIKHDFDENSGYYKEEFYRERAIMCAMGLSYIANLDLEAEKEFISSGVLKENPVKGAYQRAEKIYKKITKVNLSDIRSEIKSMEETNKKISEKNEQEYEKKADASNDDFDKATYYKDYFDKMNRMLDELISYHERNGFWPEYVENPLNNDDFTCNRLYEFMQELLQDKDSLSDEIKEDLLNEDESFFGSYHR